MTEKQQYSDFYAEVSGELDDRLTTWLNKRHAVTTVREDLDGLIRLRIHTHEPVYQSNLKKSLSTALQLPLSQVTLRVPKRFDLKAPTTHVATVETDRIDTMSMEELRARLRESQAMQAQIDNLTKLITETQHAPTTIVNNGTIINNITLNNFGEEDLSYLESPDTYLRMRKAGIVLVIKHIHFNKDHPANRTVRLKSLKHQLAEVNVAGDWQVASLRSTEDRMINKAHAYIARGIDPTNVDDATLQWMRDARTRDVTSHLREDVKSLLVNQRNDKSLV